MRLRRRARCGLLDALRVHFPSHLLIPLACALLYVVAALTIKRAGSFGVGVWRTSFVANWAMFLVFLPWWFAFGGTVRPLADYWQPALTALCFLGGQVFIFLAISKGDVSITTPVMGSKVILVALFSSLLRVGEVPLKWWIGAALSAAAVALLHAGEKHGQRRHVGTTVLLATASAASYGLGDVLMQKWVPAWGTASFFPPMFLLVGLYSFAFVPFFSAPLGRLSREAWRWVGTGALLMAVNNAGIVLTLGIWGGATAVNTVYSARGLLSVVLVWAIGHWFASTEQHLDARVLRFRLIGAALMIGAIALVLV
jgi:drug/metabolite transporter (DMT)-like permease